jgi:recombination protein RecA
MPTMIDPKGLDEIIKYSKRKYDTHFRSGSAYPVVGRIPFESPVLQIATGGGIPLGRISRLWGRESGGKTLNSLLLTKHAQNIHVFAEQLLDHPDDRVKEKAQRLLEKFPEGMTVCWYDAEGSFDKKFATDLGVDVDKLQILPNNQIEIIGDVLYRALPYAHLHIIDSVSSAVSGDELKEDISKWQRAIKARSWNKVLDRFESGIDKQENAILFIDQIRIDQNTGANIIPGGAKLRHVSSLTVEFTRGKKLYKKGDDWSDQYPQTSDKLSEKPEEDGVEFLAYVNKSKVGEPGRRARMRYDFANRKFMLDYELAKCAAHYGIIEKSGSWFEIASTGEKMQGINGLMDALKENLELRQEVLNKIQEVIIGNP